MALPRRFLPSISSLRALEALDRLGSATAAAAELSQTQSAVSRQLKTLEDQLGTTLILRRGRSIHLTPEAADYADKIRGALQQIAQASVKLTAHPAGGHLRLAILPTFGMRWLVPRLADFARLHPEVTINLSTRLKPFNFVTEPFDAAIHFGKPDWLGTDGLWLRTERVVAVATPEFLARHAPVTGPADLLRLPLLQIETRPEAWPAWFAAQGVSGAQVSGMIYDQFSTITQAALHGLGVALLPDFLAEQELAAGRLRSIFGDNRLISGAYYLVWPVQNGRDPALCTFRDWLAGQTGDEDLLPR